jgi:DNA (cytosine-5)-methyltransferase 1
LKYNFTYTHLDLFSGIGGFSLGLESTGGFETVAFCEFDKAAQKVLKLRWPNVPIFEDIRGIDENTLSDTNGKPSRQRGHDWADAEKSTERGAYENRGGTDDRRKSGAGENEADGGFGIDIITGGFPCQPFSVAGKRAGTEDNRYLWPELLRVIQLVKPTWCILENVRGLLGIEDGLVFENCLLDLEAAGYEHQTLVIPACAVNAQHRRDRVWILAHSVNSPDRAIHQQAGEKDGIQGKHWKAGRSWMPCGTSGNKENVADTIPNNAQRQLGEGIDQKNGSFQGKRQVRPCGNGGRGRPTQSRLGGEFDGISHWLDESGLPKVSSGVPKRANRLKQLGNSIVPQIAAAIGYAILEI